MKRNELTIGDVDGDNCRELILAGERLGVYKLQNGFPWNTRLNQGPHASQLLKALQQENDEINRSTLQAIINKIQGN